MQKRKFRVAVCACALAVAGPTMLESPATAATEKVLYSFTGAGDGSQPVSGLTYNRGAFYGTTFWGGTAAQGVVYKLAPSSSGWTETVIHTFQGGTVDGANPMGQLVFDAAGNLYGTTIGGGTKNHGIVYELTSSGSGWTEAVIHGFQNNETPSNAGVIIDAAGHLYGTTGGGGSQLNDGIVYEMRHTSSGWEFRSIHTFMGGNDGVYPSGGLIFDSAGNLYGATLSGGPGNNGTVFELQRGTGGTWTENVLYIFQDTADGVNPNGPLVMDAAGNLYGTTVYGGDTSCARPYGCGEVFELSPSSGTWTKTTLYEFTGTPDGHAPSAGLTFDKAGNLWGTTSNGGTTNTGALFELAPQSGGGWTESVEYSFTNGKDGGFVATPVMIDSAGNIYGTSQFGGASTEGIVYEFPGLAGK